MAAFFFRHAPDTYLGLEKLNACIWIREGLGINRQIVAFVRQEVNPLEYAALLEDAKALPAHCSYFIPKTAARPEEYFTRYMREDGTVFYAGTMKAPSLSLLERIWNAIVTRR